MFEELLEIVKVSLGKLSEYVRLEKCSYNYLLTNRNIHSDYFEMASLCAIGEAKQGMLLCGQSNS